jgi:hypothetical protein
MMLKHIAKDLDIEDDGVRNAVTLVREIRARAEKSNAERTTILAPMARMTDDRLLIWKARYPGAPKSQNEICVTECLDEIEALQADRTELLKVLAGLISSAELYGTNGAQFYGWRNEGLDIIAKIEGVKP